MSSSSSIFDAPPDVAPPATSSSPADSSRRLPLLDPRRAAWISLLFLLVLLTPLRLWRASLESSLWLDETYTLALVSHDVPHLLDHTAHDAHPPGYYLLLKLWNRAGKALGTGPSLLWSRSLNVLVWLALLLAAWEWGRRSLGFRGATVLAGCVAAGASAGYAAKDLRGYALAAVAAFVCFLLLAEAATSPRSPRASARLWMVYAVTAAVGLWVHLLTGLVLLLMGFVWIRLAARSGGDRRSILVGGAAAQGLALAAYSPWLFNVADQLTHIANDGPDWRTPRTVANLLRVFSYWYPFGALELMTGLPGILLQTLGWLTLLVPVAGAVVFRRRGAGLSPEDQEKARRLFTTAAIGFVISGLFPLLLWLIHLFNWSRTFHGPRYPVIASSVWAASLACLSLYAALHTRRKGRTALLLLAPWFLSAAVGQAIALHQENHRGFARSAAAVPDFPAAGSTLYAMPKELIPYYAHGLRNYRVRPVEELARLTADTPVVHVVNLNWWGKEDKEGDQVARALFERSALSKHMQMRQFPPASQDYKLYTLRQWRGESARVLLRHGFSAPPPPVPENAVAVARHESQLEGDGWSPLNVEPVPDGLITTRWGMDGFSRIVFDRPVAAGRYVMHVAGLRHPFPRPDVEMQFGIEGRTGEHRVVQPPGHFETTWSLTLEREMDRVTMTVKHPVWKPADHFPGADDRRDLTFMFKHAWIEREP